MKLLLTHVLLPLLIFLFLTFTAFHLIVHQSLLQNGLQSKISAICEPFDLEPHPYRLPYTGITNVDAMLCGMVVFFHALIDTASTACLAVLFPALGIVALIPFLEAARDRHPLAPRMPTNIGILIQLASMGVIMPLYALQFVITHTASLQPSPSPTSSPSKINQGNAEALLFGLVLGYILPTILMLSFVRPTVTAVWQGFPLLIALAILVHKTIRPPSRLVQSGHPTVVVTLTFSFLLSALLHVVYVWPVLTDTAALQTIFVPTVDVFDPEATSLGDGVLEFIKWDVIFGVGSIVLATFWMADSLVSLVGIIVWYGIANIAVGPAAAIAGVLLWRERRLNEKTQVEKIPQKME